MESRSGKENEFTHTSEESQPSGTNNEEDQEKTPRLSFINSVNERTTDEDSNRKEKLYYPNNFHLAMEFTDAKNDVSTNMKNSYGEFDSYKSIKDTKNKKNSKEMKRNFRRKCKGFILINGILHHQGNAKTPLRVLKSTEMDDTLKRVHSDESGGHLGITKTWHKIWDRYFWKNSFEHVKKIIEECDQCQRKAPLKKASKPLRPIEVKSDPFYQIGMDLVGPLETTKHGKSNILYFIFIKKRQYLHTKRLRWSWPFLDIGKHLNFEV